MTLKEDPRYDFIEIEADYQTQELPRMYSRPVVGEERFKVASLPTGGQRFLVNTANLQSYLREVYPHVGGKSQAARDVRLENQRKHDLCAARGNWQMSRTS